jgi:hypothetical protein
LLVYETGGVISDLIHLSSREINLSP